MEDILLRQELIEELSKNKRYQQILNDMYGEELDCLSDTQLIEFVENRKSFPNVLTLAETNRIIENKVPMELRLKAVYGPILCAFIAMRKFQQAIDILTNLRANSVKKITRRMKETISAYDTVLYRQMKPELYRQVQRAVDLIIKKEEGETFNDVRMFLDIFDNTLYSEAEENDAVYEDLTDIVVQMLSAIEFSKHVQSLDKKYAEYVNKACGDMVTYKYHVDERLESLKEDAFFIVDAINLPEIILAKRVRDARDKLFSVMDNIDVKLINQL